MNQKYLLFPDCKIINGCKKSAIYDLRRGRILFIPDSLSIILSENNGFPYSQLKQTYPEEQDTISEYLDFLLSEEFILKSDSYATFGHIDENFETPYLIDNMIIDIDSDSNHNYQKIRKELEYLGCPYVLLRFYSKINVEELLNILAVFESSRVRDMAILLPYQPFFVNQIKKKIFKMRIVSEITLHSAPYNNLSVYQDLSFIYTRKIITDETHCGTISIRNFSVNLKMFLDSKNYNNCLHKKVSIDRYGNIKNCPSSSKIFGKHDRDSLIDAVHKDGFKDLWYIKKDNIGSCNICVFRYMCLDCRIYRSDLNNVYSKPLKCNYDVYKENDENSLRI